MTQATQNALHTIPTDWERLAQLRSAAVADALDDLGLRDRCMTVPLQAILPDDCIVGRAVTIQAVAVVDVPADALLRELEAVDSLQPHDVVVADASAAQGAFWGELLSTAAKARGGAGAIVDGWVRDIAQMRQMGFPVIARGGSPYDSRGRLDTLAVNRPIRCGGVAVRPGDVVVGDVDGVAVIPADRVQDVLRIAEEKLAGEDRIRSVYASGRSATEVFRESGVL